MTTGKPYTPPISEGRPGAPIGTREWADWLRVLLLSDVQQLGKQDSDLVSRIEFIKQHRAWTLMNRPDGSFFTTIEDFCATKRPYGLGTPWEKLRPFLVAGMAKEGRSPDEIERTLQLETVPQAMPPKPGPGRGHKVSREIIEGKTKGNECPSFSDRAEKQLRAINRAPDAVKDAYREGRISQTLAAKLGPAQPTPDAAAVIAEIAQEIRKVPERKAVDELVRTKLGQPVPTKLDRARKAVDALTQSELEALAEYLRTKLEGCK